MRVLNLKGKQFGDWKVLKRIENLILFPNHKAHLLFKHLGRKTFICKFCNKDQRN